MFLQVCVRNFVKIDHLVLKVMIKKPISDEKFRISLRQSWKKIVGTPYAIYYNYPHVYH